LRLARGASRDEVPGLYAAGAMDPCVPNIGRRERRRRLTFGLLSFAVAAVLALLLARSPVWLRALVFLPSLTAAYGVFQYLDKT
jgi:hypothetical protein